MKRLAIFASGNGTNAEAVIRHFKNHKEIEVALIASNNAAAYVLQRAKHHDIPSLTFDKELYREGLTDILKEKKITHIVLAGFLWLIRPELLREFPQAINIHPSLLPKYGGRGMYGNRVHEAVKAAGEKETGITIHRVNEAYDKGKIILQKKTTIESDDSPEDIANKVHDLEHRWFPPAIEEWVLAG
ncbi:MAG: phosphoribosylglycinamide formyltransferase [Candidatus Nephrothrix sp. EaCA]|nr:MAG: phosphoribosylglycinamide formyltransferase [Candidatus Nephrothrix sp. EaCA]